MSDAVIRLDNVSKDYWSFKGKVRALHQVSFEHRRGRVLGLLGPNGAGKTTMIKLILGLVRMNQGKLEILGYDRVNSKVKEQIGFMPEESYLYPFLTVQETVRFALSLYSGKKHRMSSVDAILKRVGMSAFKNRKISECSKGMARRTALAQALIHDPDLVLLDEPTSGFDPMGTAEMKEIILDLKKQGKSILLCSHQLADVEEVCDDVVILMRGHVVVQGELMELLSDTNEESVTVKREDCGQLHAFLNETGISFKQQKVGKLEKFFIQKVQSWSSV